MKYRKYNLVLVGMMLMMSAGLVACSSSQRSPTSIDEERYDGNEPSQSTNRRSADYSWLDTVENNFGKVAASGSNRSLASQDENVLFRQKNISFAYQGGINQFVLNIDGQSYRMVQTNLGESGQHLFAASGANENPPNLSIGNGGNRRGLASASHCKISLSYFNNKKSAYAEDSFRLDTKTCAKLTQRLKEYVP